MIARAAAAADFIFRLSPNAPSRSILTRHNLFAHFSERYPLSYQVLLPKADHDWRRYRQISHDIILEPFLNAALTTTAPIAPGDCWAPRKARAKRKAFITIWPIDIGRPQVRRFFLARRFLVIDVFISGRH